MFGFIDFAIERMVNNGCSQYLHSHNCGNKCRLTDVCTSLIELELWFAHWGEPELNVKIIK